MVVRDGGEEIPILRQTLIRPLEISKSKLTRMIEELIQRWGYCFDAG